MAILNSGIAIITRITVDNAADHAKVLGILDLEPTELRAVLYEGDLALKVDSKVLQPLIICLVATSAIGVSSMDTTNNCAGK